MKAVRFHKTGGPAVLAFEKIPDVTAEDGGPLIHAEVAGAKFADVM